MAAQGLETLQRNLNIALMILNGIESQVPSQLDHGQGLQQLHKENESLRAALDEGKLQMEQVMSRLREEEAIKVTLSQELQSLKQENQALQQGLVKATNDYQDLKTMYDKNCSLSKDDKVTVLRNITKALEYENSLLMKERENQDEEIFNVNKKLESLEKLLLQCETVRDDLQQELEAKDQERVMFHERFERMQSEKMGLLSEMSSLQSELGQYQDDIAKLEDEKCSWSEERLNYDDLLHALREGKRVVESKLQNVLTDNAGLSEQVSVSETRALSLEETVRRLEREKRGSMSSANQMEQTLAEATSLYEAKMLEMQTEVSLRLEEIDNNKEKEMKAVKDRYIGMFNEKAEELHTAKSELKVVKEELASAKRIISDLEYKEEELKEMLKRSHSNIEDQFKDRQKEVEGEIIALRDHCTNLELELEATKKQCDDLQDSYRNSVDLLGRRLYDISDLLKAYQEQEEKLNKAKAAMDNDSPRPEALNNQNNNNNSSARSPGKRRTKTTKRKQVAAV